jgi:hypothetical protein
MTVITTSLIYAKAGISMRRMCTATHGERMTITTGNYATPVGAPAIVTTYIITRRIGKTPYLAAGNNIHRAIYRTTCTND